MTNEANHHHPREDKGAREGGNGGSGGHNHEGGTPKSHHTRVEGVDAESKDYAGARETADLTEVVCPAAPFRIEKNFRLTGK